MRLSLAATPIGLISVASACMEVIVQFNQYTSIIEMVYVYDNNGFICHLDGQRHVEQDGEEILLTCDAPPPSGKYTQGSTGYTARLIKQNERGLPVTAIHEWSMLVGRGEWVASFALEQQGDWDDEKIYMTGKVWGCEQGEYANIEQHNAEIWGSIGK